MSGVSGASGASSSNNSSSSFSESDSSNDSQSDVSSVSSINDNLSSSQTTSDELSNAATTQQQLTAEPTVEERIAAERTTAEQLMGVDAGQATQTPADVKADEMIANNSRTINMRGGNPSVQRLDTESLAHDVVKLSHTDPKLANDVTESLANKLNDTQYESFGTQLETAYKQQAQAYQNLAGDQLAGKIEVDAAAASELADKLMDNATTVSGTRSGSTRETLDVNELAYQLEAAAKQDPAMAMAAKMTIDNKLSANQLGELNRLVGGGDTFVDNMSLAVSHPVEGLVGAGKNFVNGLSDLSEFAIQGFGYYGAARINHSAAMVSLTNPELGQQLFDQAAVSIEEVKKIDVPSFELTNRAQRGGAVIGTAAELATGVGALVKGGIKLATKADDIVEIVVRSQDEASEVVDNLPTRVQLDTRTEFRNVSKDPQPNTVYEFDGITYTTDDLGRGVSSSGELRLGAGGNRFHDDRLIGHQGIEDDIAFHAGADEFGFQGGALNLSPGNKSLNIREYRAFERELKGLLEQGHTVDVDFRRVFYPNNTTVRPDEYRVIYQVDNGEPEIRSFFNREGG